MKRPEQLEDRLANLPLRRMPVEWKAEVLAAAAEQHKQKSRQWPEGTAGLARWLQDLLWPSPAAWGALGAVWLIALGMHLFSSDSSDERSSIRPSESQQRIILEQRRFEAEVSKGALAPLLELQLPQSVEQEIESLGRSPAKSLIEAQAGATRKEYV